MRSATNILISKFSRDACIERIEGELTVAKDDVIASLREDEELRDHHHQCTTTTYWTLPIGSFEAFSALIPIGSGQRDFLSALNGTVLVLLNL